MDDPTMSDGNFRSFNNRALPYTPIRSVTTVSSLNSNWSFRSVSSASSTDSSTFWKTPPKKWRPSACGFRRVPIPGLTILQQQYDNPLHGSCHTDLDSISSRRLILLTILLALVLMRLILLPTYRDSMPSTVHDLSAFQPVRATLPATDKKKPDPIRWLKENSNNRYAVSRRSLPNFSLLHSSKPRAALISLVRNSELEGMMQSMRQLEFRWNRKYQVAPFF